MPDDAKPAADAGPTDVLQQIATVLRDSEQGYRAAADNTTDADLKQTFDELRAKRGEQAEEVDQALTKLGGEASSKTGSTAGKAHRLFLDLKTALGANDRRAVISEIVRGEAYAEAQFDKALRAELPPDARQIVERQHVSVRETRDKFRQMHQALGGSDEPGGWLDTVSDGGRKAVDSAAQYVAEQPMTGTAIALGVGFVLGVIATISLRPSRADYLDYLPRR